MGDIQLSDIAALLGNRIGALARGIAAVFQSLALNQLARGQRGVRLHDDVVGDFALAYD